MMRTLFTAEKKRRGEYHLTEIPPTMDSAPTEVERGDGKAVLKQPTLAWEDCGGVALAAYNAALAGAALRPSG